MKLKRIFLAAAVLVLAVPFTAYSQVGIGEKPTQAKPVTIACPQELQIGPVFVPDGWESLGSLPKQRLQIKVDTKAQAVICEYGNEAVLFQTFFISRKIPADYDCKIPYPKDYQAVCTRKTRPRPGAR